MIRTARSLAIVITLSLSAAACTAGEGDDKDASSPAPQDAPLRNLGEISLTGDPMAEIDTGPSDRRPRPVGEVRLGANRLVAYLAGARCGILVIDAKKNTSIGLQAAWPKNSSDGSRRLPGGPYLSSSASGSPHSDPWASLSCGQKSMIIEYEARRLAPASQPRGSISVEQSRNTRTSFVAIGSKDTRTEVLGKLPSRTKS